MDDVTGDVQKVNGNTYVRLLVSALCLMIAAMVVYKFLKVQPIGQVDGGLITLLAFLLVLSLAEAFDSFSIAKVISISREGKKKDKELQAKETGIKKLEAQNAQLLNHIVSVVNTQSQISSHLHFQGHQYVGVGAALPMEAEEAKSNENSQTLAVEPERPVQVNGQIPSGRQEPESPSPPPLRGARWDLRKVEEFGLAEFSRANRLNNSFIRDAKIQYNLPDPVATMPVIFDAFATIDGIETFVDVRPVDRIPLAYRDRLYVMLTKIGIYSSATGKKARLLLYLVRAPDGTPSSELGPGGRNLLDYFTPAIGSGLLQIVEVTLTPEEAASATSRP